jgi:hypothetical protein
MAERLSNEIAPGKNLTFKDLDNLPSAQEGVLKNPHNPLD